MKIPFFRICGLIIFILSIIILIFTKVLFLKFLLSSSLLIVLYLFIYYIIIFFKFKKNKIELLSVYDGSVYPLKEIVLNMQTRNYPSSFPGIFFQIGFSVFELNNFVQKINTNPVLLENQKIKINCTFNRHGSFILKDFTFIIKDIFGFTKYETKCELNHQIQVNTYYEGEIEIPFFADEGGEQVFQTVTKINSTDFFENRKYYPGDDPRRINWKIFAHINELHVRDVEKVPPKIGEITLIFAPYSTDFFEYEYISSIFLSTCYFLLKNNFELKILSPVSENYSLIKEQNEKDFNSIVDNSYKILNGKGIYKSEYPIIFASFDEFKRLSLENLLKKCFCAVSFFEGNENKKSLINSFYKIEHFDNFFKEFIFQLKQIKDIKEKEQLLEEYKSISVKNKVELKIYKVTNEQYAKK
jgi:hypothetical protein